MISFLPSTESNSVSLLVPQFILKPRDFRSRSEKATEKKGVLAKILKCGSHFHLCLCAALCLWGNPRISSGFRFLVCRMWSWKREFLRQWTSTQITHENQLKALKEMRSLNYGEPAIGHGTCCQIYKYKHRAFD